MKNLNRRQRTIGKLIIVNVILLIASIYWYGRQGSSSVQVAVAKGNQLYAMMAFPEARVNDALAQNVVLADPEMAAMLAGKAYEFVNAIPLSEGEARAWQDKGCGNGHCAHVTLYNHTDGGTIEAVVNMEEMEVIGRWTDALARPAGSRFVLPKAMDIAAADTQVQSVLGQIGEANPAMIPMSGWLADNACRQEWCVDLTFHDPAGSGRIFHVFVNMEQEEVARTFYTRGRPDRSYAAPPEQRNAFTDGCHEQYGWNVCWEMTGHDGVDFRDATYNGQTIFTSVKIGQIEAWYPSWPGGYRDEIGFSASVPPFGDTQINDLGDSFEVRQLFTEFTRWPNCICCYRYEEIIRFYMDGTFELRFVSHGPGCDDLSVYRPFWRVDLDLDGPEGDEVWLWQETEWVEAETEFETTPLVDDRAPEGHKLATFDGELHYQWIMEHTDPLGLDEAFLFALQEKEGEGDGPVLTGPGDTYQPPRQWLGDEALSGNDIVLWYVPLLKTKKGGPWWCMPDPEPEFSPCEAILRAEPATELHQPTAEELAEMAQPTPTAGITPTPETTAAPTATPRPIEGEDAEEVILNAGCGACHAIGALGEAGKVGPDLSNIGNLAAERIPEMTAEAYLRQSILEPNAFIVPDCPNGPCLANVMPGDYQMRLSPEQIDIIVAFLLAQQDESATTTPAPIGSETAAADEPTPLPKAFPAPKRLSEQPASAATIAIQILLVSLVFLLSLFRLLKEVKE